MKILIIIDSLGSGGTERSIEVLCDYLHQVRISFEILCLAQKTVGVQQRMQQRAYKITFVPAGTFYSQSKFIANYIKRGDFSLIHSILFRSNLRTRFARSWTKFVNLESLVNTTYSKECIKDERVNQTGLKIYKFIDKIASSTYVNHSHSITETVKDHYVKKLGLKLKKISVIPRGCKPIIPDFEARAFDPSVEPVQLI